MVRLYLVVFGPEAAGLAAWEGDPVGESVESGENARLLRVWEEPGSLGEEIYAYQRCNIGH